MPTRRGRSGPGHGNRLAVGLIGVWIIAEERRRLGLTQRQVAELMGVTPGRVSQIENGDLDANEVATLGRYARALGARMRIIFDYGSDLRQIA
ncbi:helix-turn-helix domain-containing protein [Micromonospora sp. NPDC002575]|uniref:helix-turn-helix domain-containing protein n=1 Tax=Micromonospora sp. NPDC002575 TaxID=3364222 RepID=UPI0036CD16F6